MSTWYSKHVEESNNIWRINNIQCITLVVLYGTTVSLCLFYKAALHELFDRKADIQNSRNFIIIIIIIIIIIAIELSLGGSSPYNNTDKTNKDKYT